MLEMNFKQLKIQLIAHKISGYILICICNTCNFLLETFFDVATDEIHEK
jgi:hypothetical protein